jgi:purine nucleosidase
MHDVLDDRDLVPDEAEQLATSGYDVGPWWDAARDAARAGDLPRLREVPRQLAEVPRAAGWRYDEPAADASGPARRPRPCRGPTSSVPAAQFLVDTARAEPGSVSVICIGPMTNVATAMAMDPGFADNVDTFYLMAGSARTYANNLTVLGDFNAYVDPEALAIVLAGLGHARMIGIDQTSSLLLTRDDAARLRSSADAFGRWAGVCADAWIDFLHAALPTRAEHETSCFLHDPLVVATAIDPARCRWENAFVQVELGGQLTRGLVVADRGLALQRPAGPPNAAVAVDTDVDRCRRLILGRLETPAAAGPPTNVASALLADPGIAELEGHLGSRRDRLGAAAGLPADRAHDQPHPHV